MLLRKSAGPALATLLWSLTISAQGLLPTYPDDRAAGASTFDPAQIHGWLETLTSPEFAGRGTGQEGFRLAAEFMRDHFAGLGLKPMGDDGSYGFSGGTGLAPLP